jgi:hypothetical protein
MRVVNNKHGFMTIVGRDEFALFNKIDMQGFMPISSMTEQEEHHAHTLYTRDILRKVRRGTQLGYKTHPQQRQL